MVKLKNNQPVRPYYISASDVVNAAWSKKFAAALVLLGSKYNVPQALIDKVTANDLVLQSIKTYEDLLAKMLNDWRLLKLALYDAASTNRNPINLPGIPTFPARPDGVGPYVLGPHIQAAEIILADPTLTDIDREALGLVRAEGKPVPPEGKRRDKAELYNYPLMKVTVSNNVVDLVVVRGNRFKGKAVLIQVDRTGTGDFTKLISTNAGAATDTVSLPVGVLAATWTYRAIYIEGEAIVSDWCPNIYVSVTQEASPFSEEEGNDQENNEPLAP